MNEEQAAKIIELLTKIDDKLDKLSRPIYEYKDGKWVKTDGLQLDVNVMNDSLTVDGEVTARDPR